MKPNSIDQAEKDARLVSSTMNRNPSNLSPKAIAAELVVAFNKDAASKSALVAPTDGDQYFSQPLPSTSSVQPFQCMPQQPFMAQQFKPPLFAFAATPVSYPRPSRPFSSQQYTSSYRFPSQSRPQRSYTPQQQQSNWGQPTYGFNRQGGQRPNRPFNNQFGQYNNQQFRPNTFYKGPFNFTSRPDRTGPPYCRHCACQHSYGTHVGPSYSNQWAIQGPRAVSQSQLGN